MPEMSDLYYLGKLDYLCDRYIFLDTLSVMLLCVMVVEHVREVQLTAVSRCTMGHRTSVLNITDEKKTNEFNLKRKMPSDDNIYFLFTSLLRCNGKEWEVLKFLLRKSPEICNLKILACHIAYFNVEHSLAFAVTPLNSTCLCTSESWRLVP